MIYNIIGPPGSGKTTYIQKKFGFAPPMTRINTRIFDWFVQQHVFEHTGLNPKINDYLASAKESICTIWFQTPAAICLIRILKDAWTGKASLKQTLSRIKILRYYRRNARQIYLPPDQNGNSLWIRR